MWLCAGLSCTPGPAPSKPPKPHPNFPIGEGTFHALGTTTADGEIKCTSCHALTNTTYAQFECTGCHEHAQDQLEPLHLRFDGYVYASTGCYACHHDGRVTNSPFAALDASDPARDAKFTALLPTWSGPTIVAVTPEDESLAMPMNHRSAQVSAELAANCSACHLDAQIGLLFPGQYHASLAALSLPQPTACGECHQEVPGGFVGTIDAARTPPTGQMNHGAVDWAGGAPTANAIVTGDCGVCHVAPADGGTWEDSARFHPALTVSGTPQPTSCIDCHANTRPGVISATTGAALPAGVTFNHAATAWLGDCAACHQAGFGAWSGGKLHETFTNPPTCLPCHAGERPTSGTSPGAPFDFGTNVNGITHGDGQDCAVCHANTSGWSGGHFPHGPGTVAVDTCVACHTTQRPTMLVSGFDHSTSGTGDCLGCHQATTAFTQLSDWAGGQSYPGAFLISSTDQFITVTEISLKRGANNLITGTTSTQTTLFNSMLHTSTVLPAAFFAGPAPGDSSTCGRCHPSAPTAFLGGRLHDALADGGVAQPTGNCTDCHENMRPSGVVQAGTLRPMDHAAQFKTSVDVGGAMVTSVSALDCSVCHADPGGRWDGGAFHTAIPGAAQQQLADCAVCHYTLMADPAVDVISTASPNYAMKHRSAQMTLQACDTCHASALANAGGGPDAGQWAPATFHPNVAPPGACVDCHLITEPATPVQSAVAYHGDQQWMSHAVAVSAATDCVACHAGNEDGGTWVATRGVHATIHPSACSGCHGPANGGAANNMPTASTDSSTVTSASASTGVAGQHDQIAHSDLNVTSHDCRFCHTQVGPASGALAGQEWAQASFHANFTGGAALVMNGSTGRCSNCHLNLKPTASFTAQDHSSFSAAAGTKDCSSCHSWPGTGSASAPNWHQVTVPSALSVGGFTIPQPPAPNGSTVQAGLNNLAHPALASGAACTTCHTQATGGRNAFAYDHSLAPSTGCSSCHEAGSDLVGTPWTSNAAGAMNVTATCVEGSGTVADRGGDTRPIGLSSLACSSNASGHNCGTGQTCVQGHFYPADCGECHAKPTGVATVQTGAAYASAWAFKHYFGAPARNPGTCSNCH